MNSAIRLSTLIVTIIVMAELALVSTALAADGSAPDTSQLQADNPSGSVQHLYEECTGASVYGQMECVGYISGVADNMTIVGAGGFAPEFGVCPKTAVTYGADVQAFKNWAQKHPEAWGFRRWIGVASALRDTWPCR
jgi:hypothetical protein